MSRHLYTNVIPTKFFREGMAGDHFFVQSKLEPRRNDDGSTSYVPGVRIWDVDGAGRDTNRLTAPVDAPGVAAPWPFGTYVLNKD